ncbi:hypothetical protein H7X46_13160 [Pseudonocardia sp. C8]|uniref:hypothetical protein n=1 Tax=Pseudonocardia sp. C8 TaxID=2762759 RepID=UPI00164344E4|nr:hypothetical protein [Pseudonocardia sp. C8]MBC3192015.1 hypothetical protein [Pseudonocardia sp. C8]
MGGRHRAPRVRRSPARRAARAAVPVVAAVAAVVAVVALVAGSDLLAPGAPPPTIAAGAAVVAAPPPRTAPVLELPESGPAATAAADAARAVAERAERDQQAEQNQRGRGTGTCDLTGPARFDDPERPHEITNKDCGYVDAQGRERSLDPWLDGQLLAAQGG